MRTTSLASPRHAGMQQYTRGLRAAFIALLLPLLGSAQELVLDAGFNSGSGLWGGFYDIALLPDGRIVCGGSFESFDGTPQRGALWLTVEGDLDPGFAPQFAPGDWSSVFAITVQNDGHVLLGGNFNELNGSPAAGLARVDAYGATDATFTHALEGYFFSVAVAGNGNVFAGGTLFNDAGGLVILDPSGATIASGMADDAADHLQTTPDGDILCGGRFQGLNGNPGKLGRISAAGVLDTSLTVDVGPAVGTISDVALQPDGRILISGSFAQVNGMPRKNIARLEADGSLDESFDPGAGFDEQVNAIAVLPNGDMLVGGPFTMYNDVPLNGKLVRLDPNGSLLTIYEGNSLIHDLAVQPDGKVLVCGGYLYFNGILRKGIMRLMPDPGTGLATQDPEMIPANYDPQSCSLVLTKLLNGPTGLTLQDMSGRTVLRIERPCINGRIDVRALPVGIYLLEGRVEGRMFRSRFFKY